MAEAAAVDCDAAALGLVLSRAWSRSVSRVLDLAARADAVSRRAVALNAALARAGVERRVAVVMSDPPLSVADPLWLAVLDNVARPSEHRSTPC